MKIASAAPVAGLLVLIAFSVGCRKEVEKPLDKRNRVLKPLVQELRGPRTSMETRLVGKTTEQEEDAALVEIATRDLPKISSAARQVADAASSLKSERAQKSSADFLADVETSARAVSKDCASLDSIPKCRTSLAALDMVLARDPVLAKLAQPEPPK